jgi:HSP20 family protein
MKTEISKPTETSLRPRDLLSAMRDEMDRVFGRFEHDWLLPGMFGRNGRHALMVPDIDLRENTNAMAIDAELPGVDDKDISVTVSNGVLTIRAEKKQEREQKEENYYLSERSFGSFERSLRLPETIDESKLEARFEKGVLKIRAPKKPEAVKSERKIEVKSK